MKTGCRPEARYLLILSKFFYPFVPNFGNLDSWDHRNIYTYIEERNYNGANVFCFLSSLLLLPPATAAVFGSYLSSLYFLLTLYRGWGLAYPYDLRGFVGPKKKTSVALSVLNPPWEYCIRKFYTSRTGLVFKMKRICLRQATKADYAPIINWISSIWLQFFLFNEPNTLFYIRRVVQNSAQSIENLSKLKKKH